MRRPLTEICDRDERLRPREVLRKVPQEQLVDQLFLEIDAWIALACLA